MADEQTSGKRRLPLPPVLFVYRICASAPRKLGATCHAERSGAESRHLAPNLA